MDFAQRTRHTQHPPLASPASASSSTLITITTPLPASGAGSKESLRLPSFPPTSEVVSIDDAAQRPRSRPPQRVVTGTTGTGVATAPLPTRMSASGFVEPHHSNVPRRVRTQAQKDTKSKPRNAPEAGTGDGDGSEDSEEEDARHVRALKQSVKEALTPGRRWSDSEDEERDEDDGDNDSQRATLVQHDPPISTTQGLAASESIYAHSGSGISATPGRPGPTPTSSRNLNTERTPLHLLSLRLPPSPSDNGPVLASAPAVAAGVGGGGPIQTQSLSQAQIQALQHPHTAPAAADGGAFPVLPQTPPMPHTSTLSQQPTSSLRPATLPRRRKATPTPLPVPAPSTMAKTDGTASPPPATPPRPSASASGSHHAHIRTPTPTPTPGPSKIQTSGTVGVRFHGPHPSSSSSSSSTKGSVRPRTGSQQQHAPTPNKRVEILRAAVGADNVGVGVEGHVRLGRRNTVSNGAGAGDKGKEKAKGERSRSLANPRSRTRTRSRARSGLRDGGTGSTSISKAKEQEGPDGCERTTARDQRLAEREKRRKELEERRVVRRRMEERMCVQRVGSRGRVEVAFFLDVDQEEQGLQYVLLQVVEPEDEEDEGNSDSEVDVEEGTTPIATTSSSSEIPSQLSLTPTVTLTPGPQTDATPTKEAENTTRKELRLYLPTDLSTYIDGVSALSAAQVRQGCEFIQGVLSTSASDEASASATSRPRRVRVVAPRTRPEDAWAVALCYQARVDSAAASAAVDVSSMKTVMALKTTDITTPSPATDIDTPSTPTPARPSAGAARLIATMSISRHAQVPESSRDVVRRPSIPVPVPPLALVRGEDGEVEGVIEVALDVEALDDSNVVIIDDTVSSPTPTALLPTSSSALNSNQGGDQDSTSYRDLDADSEVEEETYMLHPTYTYSGIHQLAMRLLDEGAGEWHTRGRQWEERVERMLFTAGAAVATGAVEGNSANAGAVRADPEVHRRVRDETSSDGGEEEGDDSQTEKDGEYDDWDDGEEDVEDVISGGARQGSESTGEREIDGQPKGGDAVHANDGGENERGRSHEPHTRMGQGVPMPSKYEEPSSAFVSSAQSRSKSRARSKSKADSQQKSRARSMSISASASKKDARGRRKSRLSMSYDPFLDDGDDANEGLVDEAARNARRVELRRLRLMQRRAQKEVEEIQAYRGIRTEWRGVLSFDGLQHLVGIWTPASTAH